MIEIEVGGPPRRFPLDTGSSDGLAVSPPDLVGHGMGTGIGNTIAGTGEENSADINRGKNFQNS